MTPNALEVEGLGVRFGGTPALAGVSFVVSQGGTLAVMGRPTVLLFDEPTAGVDEPGEEGLYAMIRRLQKAEHLTLLLSSHELALVYQHADTVLCLSAGHRTAFFGVPEEVLTPERLREAYRVPLKLHVHDDHLS